MRSVFRDDPTFSTIRTLCRRPVQSLSGPSPVSSFHLPASTRVTVGIGKNAPTIKFAIAEIDQLARIAEGANQALADHCVALNEQYFHVARPTN
jgi:hypothetical protein